MATKNETEQIECRGEAHSNPFIDNCGLCAPEWGKITVCAHCKHRPREHAEDGCHGSRNDSDMASERCGCAIRFWRQGGKRTKKIVAEVTGGKIFHGGGSRFAPSVYRQERTVKAIHSGDAIRQVRYELKSEFTWHMGICSRQDCHMEYATISARGTSGSGGGYDREDFARQEDGRYTKR